MPVFRASTRLYLLWSLLIFRNNLQKGGSPRETSRPERGFMSDNEKVRDAAAFGGGVV
jgi:hypothetical protein